MDTVLIVASAGCAFLSVHLHLSMIRKENAKHKEDITQHAADLYNSKSATEKIYVEHSRGISTQDQFAELDKVLVNRYDVHNSTTSRTGNVLRTDFNIGVSTFSSTTHLNTFPTEPPLEPSPAVDLMSAFMFSLQNTLSENVEKTYDFAYL